MPIGVSTKDQNCARRTLSMATPAMPQGATPACIFWAVKATMEASMPKADPDKKHAHETLWRAPSL